MAPLTTAPTTALAAPLRVASWNLHEGLPDGEDGSKPAVDSAAEIVSLLCDNEIDFAGFQEVRLDEAGDSAILNAVTSKTPLRYWAVHRLSESSFFAGDFAGVALVSRYPLTHVRRKVLPNPNLSIMKGEAEIYSHDKGLIAARIEVPGHSVNAASLHAVPFHLFGRQPGEGVFQDVWSSLSAELRALTGRPMIVCGDFNTPDRRLVIGDGSLDLVTTFEGAPTYQDQSLDDILHSSTFRPQSTSIRENFSDHAVCVAEFAWK